MAALLLLAVLAVVAVTMFVDPNRFRGQIEAAVLRATGQPFHIAGDLEIAWYPWLALRMGPAQFGRTPGSPEPPIVEWQAAYVGAKLIPLTQGELIIDRIRLSSPRFHLLRRADGSSNWESVIASIKARVTTRRSPGPQTTPGPQIAGFEVRDGTLEYADAGSGQHLAITNWQFSVGRWRSGATVPVQTQFVYRANDNAGSDRQPPLEASVGASARVHISDDANDIDVFGLETTGRLSGGPFPQQVPITMQVSRLAARISPLDIAISEVAGQIADARFTASIQAGQTGPEKALYVRGPISLQVRSVRELLPKIGVKAPLPLDKGTIRALAFKGTCEWRAGAIAVNNIDLTLDETHFDGQLTRGAGEDALWTFTLHGDKIGLSRYLDVEKTTKKPFELPVAALRALKMQGELTFDQAWVADAQMRNVHLRVEMEDGGVTAN